MSLGQKVTLETPHGESDSRRRLAHSLSALDWSGMRRRGEIIHVASRRSIFPGGGVPCHLIPHTSVPFHRPFYLQERACIPLS